jgi:serine/threonine protein kinase, bacterial
VIWKFCTVEPVPVSTFFRVASLTVISDIDQDPASCVRQCSRILREFNHLTQHSGNVSWLVESEGQRLFVKTAGATQPPAAGAPVPYLDHPGRVRLLRNAIDLARSCDHRALPALLNVIESPAGPALVYEAATGELVGVPSEERGDPASPYQRFGHLPAAILLGLFDTLIDLHVALAAEGWVAGDLYDGCLIVDFQAPDLRVIDLDSYRQGVTTNEMGRMFGSTRFMAPEELELGAQLDERTTVFTLGRIIWHFATRLTEDRAEFCGSEGLAEELERACQPSPTDRHASVTDFANSWFPARLA